VDVAGVFGMDENGHCGVSGRGDETTA
jgi:hypothetical protein